MTLKIPPPPKKRTNKVLVELLSLQHDEVNLEQQRACMAHSTSDAARWEHLVRTQLVLKIEALCENDELRAMLHEQPSYQQQLESLVLKKPRFMERCIVIQLSLDSHTHLHDQVMKLQDDSWRVLQLGADGEKRLTAIHINWTLSIRTCSHAASWTCSPSVTRSSNPNDAGLQTTAEAMACSVMHGTQYMQTRGRASQLCRMNLMH
ncbi:hypothetical protein DYB34_007721 [Aphanomyces astaci]|uniref:Uncharacterized protein n=1 Tax=Aphanomyces astaci TaxID=112090 RepID=A0A3R6W4N1_APHAT|nr:hypothetical protein DYB34_007721 [Aphanomyces astaci]